MARSKTEEIDITPKSVVADGFNEENVTEYEVEGLPQLPWNEYILSKFADDEMVDGRPTVDGLRRVAEEELGEIVRSEAHTVMAPHGENPRATVEFTVEFLTEYGTKTYTSVADAYIGNTEHPYNLHLAATAETKAEGRALRKALRLKKVLSAEESVTEEYTNEHKLVAGWDGSNINSEQISIIDLLCKRNDIHFAKCVRMTKPDCKSINELSCDDGKLWIKLLNEYQGGKEIPAGLVGYVHVVESFK